MHPKNKRAFPLRQIRQILEPGPVVLVSSAWKGQRNIMTMGWHMVMEFEPALIGCIIAEDNHSFNMIRQSGACVINVPDASLADTVARIGNCSGADGTDKFDAFGLTAKKAQKVAAPLIGECFAHFECRLHDARLVKDYNLFIFEAVRALVARSPRHPKTLHYHGQGQFSTDGRRMNKARLFTKWRGSPTF